jgi:hypothetical protein
MPPMLAGLRLPLEAPSMFRVISLLLPFKLYNPQNFSSFCNFPMDRENGGKLKMPGMKCTREPSIVTAKVHDTA